MPVMTSSASAICGTHFGLTKLVTSISRRPASCNIPTSAILAAAGTWFFSFCRPSRGPTSTILTNSGSVAMTYSRVNSSPPSLTWSPGANSSSATVPSRGAAMVCSIFIASSTASGCPVLIASPALTR